ncbi:hypothetical protein ABPG72_019906 [Tetrahymena utriculariae]
MIVQRILFSARSFYEFLFQYEYYNNTALEIQNTKKLDEAQSCKVIGRSSTFLQQSQTDEAEKYSALYVDFAINDQLYLGYGCLSLNSEILFPSNKSENIPWAFYNYNVSKCKKRLCPQHYQYVFSQVKLPSWMCLPFDINYEDLINLKTCYFYFYNNEILNGQTQGQAYLNSSQRKNIKEAKQFALISFKKLNAPYTQYFCFLAFTLCPFVTSMSAFISGLLDLIETYIYKLYKKQKKNQQFYSF